MFKKLFTAVLVSAVLMTNMMGFLAYADQNEFRGWISGVTDGSKKEWTIQFNDSLDKDSVMSNNIYVRDSHNNIFETKAYANADNKSITIRPIDPYKANEGYYLYVTARVKSDKGTNLCEEMKIPFIINEEVLDSQETLGYVIDKWTRSGDVFYQIALPEQNGSVIDYELDIKSIDSSDENFIVFRKTGDGIIKVETSPKNFKIYSGIVKDIDDKYITISSNSDEFKFKLNSNAICYKEDSKASLSSVQKNSYVQVGVKEDLEKAETMGYLIDKWLKSGDLYGKIMTEDGRIIEGLIKENGSSVSDESFIVFKEVMGEINLVNEPKEFKMYYGVVKDIDDKYITISSNSNELKFKLDSKVICYEEDCKKSLASVYKDKQIEIVVKGDCVKGIEICVK